MGNSLEYFIRIRRCESTPATSGSVSSEGKRCPTRSTEPRKATRKATRTTSAWRRPTTTFETVFTELIVYCAFLSVGEDFECF